MLRIHYLRAIVFLLLWLVAVRQSSAYTIMGNVVSFTEGTPNAYSVEFSCESGRVRLSFLTEDIIRVHMAPTDRAFPADSLHLGQNGPYAVVRYDWPGVKYKIKEEFDSALEAARFTIRAGSLIVKVRKEPFKLHFFDVGGRVLVQEKEGTVDAGLGYEGSKVFETMSLPDDEHFFGFGPYNNPLDMRGQQMVCSPTELQSKARTGGFPVPFFLSSRGYGIFFNNLDDDVTFKMGTAPGQYSFSGTSSGMEGWDMDYYLIHGPRFEQIFKKYIEIAGPPMLPEKYFFGHIFMECCEWNADDVTYVAERFRQEDWPCDVLIIDCQAFNGTQPVVTADMDGSDGPPDQMKRSKRNPDKGGFDWADGFGDTEKMFQIVKQLGVKTILSSALQGPGLYNWPSYDPTIEGNLDEYWDAIVGRISDGLDSWRQDNSEKYHKHTSAEFFANGYASHNLFGSLWAKNVVEKMWEMGLYGRPVISRGGPVGGHRYIIPWPGDLRHGLELLPIDLNWLRNGGLSCYPFITVNLGGWGDGHGLEEHNAVRRIINIIPLVPISQLVGWGKTGENAMLPWLFSAQQQELMRYYLKFRYRLHPYLYSAAVEASQTGRPILSALVFDYQDDPNTYRLDYEFMLGRQILVAPVLEKTHRWNVYLPKGKWVHYWTGQKYTGGQTVTVEAPLYGKAGLPLFVKAGAIVPMMPAMSYIYEAAPDPITLDVYPEAGVSSSCVMFDCETVRSPVRKIVFRCCEDAERIDIAITTFDVNYNLCVHSQHEPVSVVADSQTLPRLTNSKMFDAAAKGWYYGSGYFYGSDSLRTINIKIPKSKTSRVVRIVK